MFIVALDTVNRSKVWTKSAKSAKLVVSVQGVTSSSFPCNIEVRQGGNLSPLLFSIYLADLKTFLAEQCTGLRYVNEAQEELLDREINCFLK